VLRNYVLVLANTGMRHGTEALNLKWKNLLWIKEEDQAYLGLFVAGKTGHSQTPSGMCFTFVCLKQL
jgi:hypothetical protein